jgi:flagellar hook-associated protein 2
MTIRMTGLNSGLDTESIISALMSAYNMKTDNYEKAQTKIEWKMDAWESLNTKVNSFYKSTGNLRTASGWNMYKTTSSDSTKATVSVSGTPATGTQKLHVLSTAQSTYLTGGKISKKDSTDAVTSSTTLADLGITSSTSLKVNTKDSDGQQVEKEISLTSSSTISDVISGLKDAGLNASFDSTNGRIFVSSKTTGVASDFTIESDDDNAATDSSTLTVLKALGLKTNSDANDVVGATNAVKIAGTDANILLNGVLYTGTSNYFNINGFGITVSGVTDDDDDLFDSDGKVVEEKAAALTDSTAISLSTSVDAQGIYDTIKDFLTNYNSIINEMTKLYNADDASDYEPLTDDEKDAMTDTEISKWETKIKDSLLRRDTTLSSVMSVMKNAMSQTIEVNGKKYALSSFGISTLYYGTAAENEESAYHIDGDEDDENTSGNTDKLLAAINSDPDTVVEYFKQLTTNLYNALDQKMTSTTLRSRYCIYNDKELQSQYDDYTDIISDWEDKVADKEDYYYEKFADMETALGNLNSSQSALSGLLG